MLGVFANLVHIRLHFGASATRLACWERLVGTWRLVTLVCIRVMACASPNSLNLRRVQQMRPAVTTGAKNMATRGGSAAGGMHGSGHSASEPSMHQDSSHAAWADTHSEGGDWEDGGQRGGAVQGRSASDAAQQQGQRQTDDDDSWAVRETAPASRSAAEGGRASGNFAGFEGVHPHM